MHTKKKRHLYMYTHYTLNTLHTLHTMYTDTPLPQTQGMCAMTSAKEGMGIWIRGERESRRESLSLSLSLSLLLLERNGRCKRGRERGRAC